MTSEPPILHVRPMHSHEADAVVLLWHETKLDAYPYLPLEQGRTLEEDTQFFREVVQPSAGIWLAVEGSTILRFIALQGRSYIDRLYVHPRHQGRGVGTALLGRARELSPGGLQLQTHQKNTQACAFYERHGFRVAKLGVSPAPESEPDVEYHWEPAPAV